MNVRCVEANSCSILTVVKIVCFAVVFCLFVSIGSQAQVFRSLVNFNGSQGGGPTSSLVRGPDGSFYGTTSGGGAGPCSGYVSGCGVIFKITPAGIYQPIYFFCQTYPCADGAKPTASLVAGPDGYLYGTTSSGGINGAGSGCDIFGCGTIFKMDPDGALTTVYAFCPQPNCPDGAAPLGELILGNDGNFYGTTSSGGPPNGACLFGGCGTVFKITPGGALTTLHVFSGTDGSTPSAGLVLGTDGKFYGTTQRGGVGNYPVGTIFKISPGGGFTSLYSFCSVSDLCPDGQVPYGTLAQGNDGNFYGTTSEGANYWDSCAGFGGGCGTAYKISSSGTFTTTHVFNGTEGAQSEAGLVLGTDGNFYGTTTQGGSGTNCYPYFHGCGTVFRISPAGTVIVLHNFSNTDGVHSLAALMLPPDGILYGTTAQGGTNSSGTVFSISMSSMVYSLSASTNGNGTVTSTRPVHRLSGRV